MSPAVSPAMNQMPQQQIPSNTAMGMNPQPYSPKEEKPMNKKVVIGSLCSVLAVAAVVVVILILTGGSKKINLNDYLNVEITGEYNGCATATYTFDTEKFAKDNENIKYAGERAEWGTEGQEAYDLLTELGAYDYEVGYFEKAEGLSNGETAHFYWKIDKDYIEKNFKVKLEFEDIEKEIGGLKDAETFDPFDEKYFSIYFTGVEPNGEVHVEVKSDNPYKSILNYSCDKNNGLSDGEKIVVTIYGNEADIRQECAETFGKIPATTSKEYTAEIGHYVTSASEIPKETYDAIDKQTQDELKAASVNWEKGKSYIGSRPIGSYFMKSKSEKNATRNILYRLYLVESSNYSIYNDSFEYFYSVKYENITIDKSGNVNLDVTASDTALSFGNSFKVGDNYEYLGNPTKEAFETENITPVMDEYECENALGDYSEEKLLDKCTMVTDMLEKEIKDDTTGHRYKIVFTGGDADWDATSKLCQNEGGHLVTITSEEEQKLVEKLVDPSYISVYIGGYRGDDERWHWVTGEDFTYTHWGTEEDYDNLISIGETHFWDSRNTMNALYSEYYICEWDK